MEEAVEYYDEAIKKDQKHVTAYFLKSEYFYEKKDYESALTCINKACEINPSKISFKALRSNILKSKSKSKLYCDSLPKNSLILL